MSLYSSFPYSSGFYGTTTTGSPLGGPELLSAYQNTDGTVVVYWRLFPASQWLDQFTWTVETDTVETFDSSDYVSYSSVANPNFISGKVHKGMVVAAYPRQQGANSTMYWRVKGTRASVDTNTSTSAFVIPMAIDEIDRQAMLDILPDIIWKKDFAAGNIQIQSIVLNRPLVSGNTFSVSVNGSPITPVLFAVDAATTMAAIAAAIAAKPGVGSAVVVSTTEIRVYAKQKDAPVYLFGASVTGGSIQPRATVVPRNSSNINRIFASIAKELDYLNFQTILTDNDIYTALVRDASVARNFGYLLGVQKPSGMEFIDYREIIRALMANDADSPAIAAVKRIVNAIYGVDPNIVLIRDTLDMYIDDPSSTPAVDPFYVDDSSTVPPVLPATVWDDKNLAFGVIIEVNNPMGLSLSQDFVLGIVRKIVPAFAPVYVTGI